MPVILGTGKRVYRAVPANFRKLVLIGAIGAGSSASNTTAEANTLEGYDDYTDALREAELAARRVVSAYDVSLTHLRECGFELAAARAILMDSNRNAEARTVADK